MCDGNLGRHNSSDRGTTAASDLPTGNHLAETNVRFNETLITEHRNECVARQYRTDASVWTMFNFKGTAHDIAPVGSGIWEGQISAQKQSASRCYSDERLVSLLKLAVGSGTAVARVQ